MAAQARAVWESRATPEEVGEIFKRLALACRGQPGETGTKAATVSLFMRYLSYPRSVLSAAADHWIQSQVFMPAISQMRELCDTEMKRLERIFSRAHGVIRHSQEYFRRRKEDADKAARIAEENARMTPERWAEIIAKRDAIPTGLPSQPDGMDAARRALAEGRERMRDRIAKHYEREGA